MELTRLVRILRARWLAVVVVAAVGFVAALLLTTFSNRNVEEVFETLIPMQFEPQGEETIEDLADTIQNESAEAQISAEALLNAYRNATIFPDTGAARLYFLAHGSTREESRARADELVAAYLDASPGGGDVSEKLAAMEAQAVDIHEELQSLTPTLNPEERVLASQHDLLDAQILAVRDQIVIFTVADAGATDGVKAANAAQREELRATLTDLETQKAQLAPRPVEEMTPAESLRAAALQRRLDLLGVEYERLALRTLGVTSGATLGSGLTTDLTPSDANPILFGAIGLVAGALLGWFGLAAVARARKEIWLAEDLPIPLVGAVPDRKASSVPGPAWYDSASGGGRKEAIQALRTTIEGLLAPGFNAFALVADQVDSPSYHSVAVDMAVSFASAGRSVLLIDADFVLPSDSTEYDVGEPTLGTVLRSPLGANEAVGQRMARALGDVVFIRPDLAVMPAGPAPDSPADAVAGRHMRTLLEQSIDFFDLVIVVAGEGRTAAAQALVQRVGSSLLAIKAGRSTIPAVNSLAIDLSNQRVQQLGAVMIERPDSALLATGPGTSDVRSANIVAAEPQVSRVDSPVDRLRFYPTPSGGGVMAPAAMSLRSLAEELREGRESAGEITTEEMDSLAIQVLETLRSSSAQAAFVPVAEYIVTRVEDILNVTAGQTNVSDDVVESVLDRGFAPLTRVKGLRSVGELLESELLWELGESHGGEFFAALTQTLRVGEDGYPTVIDSWLAREFFVRHIDRTGGEPEIWHLKSETGVAQVLARGRRLDRARLSRINTEVVRRAIDEFERSYKAAVDRNDLQAMTSFEDALKELHQFEVTIGVLQVGSSEDARITYPWRRGDQQPKGWYPVWTEGIRANIAPLQRLGLLAAPVLSDAELGSFEPVG